jgi:hypothetical protein
MGNMKFWWIFGFEWWGGLMPAEMTTAKGVRYVPLILGLWLKRPTKRAADVAYCAHCGGTKQSHAYRIHEFVPEPPHR